MILLRNNSFDHVHLRGHVNECILCEAQWFSGLTSEPACPPRSLLTFVGDLTPVAGNNTRALTAG